MSRSNVRVANELRKEEATLTRKKILKCGGSVRKQAAVAQHLADSGDVYLQKLEKLKKFSKDKKEVKKKLTQQAEWIQGGFYLHNLAQRIESEIPIIYQKLVVSMLQERDSSFSEVSSLVENDETSRRENQSYVMLQFHEIKGMLGNMKKHNHKHSGDDCEEATNRKQAIASVIANLIVQMKSSHENVWSALNEEEKNLNGQIKDSLVTFSRIQKEYRQVSDDSRLEDDLKALEFDDEQVLTLLEEWKQKIYVLEDDHSQSMADIAVEKLTILEQFCPEGEKSSFAGWDEQSHKIFVKVIKRAQVQGLSRQRISATLAAELPERSAGDISSHENWFNTLLSINDRKKKITEAYSNQREELLASAVQAVSALRLKVKEEKAAQEELQRHEKARSAMHALLNEQRAERMSQMEGRLEEIQRIRAQAAEENRVLDEKNKAERERKKALAEKFKKEKEEAIAVQQAKRAEELKLLAEEHRRQMLAAKPLIEQRETILKNKEIEKKRKQAQLIEEEARRLELLHRLAEQVPYWDAMQCAASKLDHITASVESHRYYKPEESSRGFQSLNGYTDKRVFKDARFRLGIALREAGVHQSSAAHAIVNNMNPRAQAPW